MARARNIKPSFFTNEDLVELAFEVRLLFIGLWTLADRDGRLEDRPKRIKMAIFPADSVDVDAGLEALAKAGFIDRYTARGVACIQVVNFGKHQNPHVREAASELPENIKHDAGTSHGYSEHCASTVPAPGEHCASHADSLNPYSLNPESGNTHTVATVESEPVDNFGGVCVQPHPSDEQPAPTQAGAACRAMRQAGIADGNPSHPTLLALLEAGATSEEFRQAAVEAHGKGKGFAYAIGTVKRRREEAAKLVLHKGRLPNKQEALEASNRAVGMEWERKMREQMEVANAG